MGAPEERRYLRLVSGPIAYPLLAGEWLMGRSGRAGIPVADVLASREHALLRVKKGEAEVEDLGSRNGTFVNERRVEGKARLLPGDRIRIGDTVYTLEEYDEATEPAAWHAGGDDTETPTAEQVLDRGRSSAAAAPAEAPPPPSPDGRARYAERAALESLISPRTALLVLGDPEWAESIRLAAAIHPHLLVERASPAEAAAAAAAVSRGILFVDLDAAGEAFGAIRRAWTTPATRGPVLVTSSRPEAEGATIARELAAAAHVPYARPAILVVALLRYHLQRTAAGGERTAETADDDRDA